MPCIRKTVLVLALSVLVLITGCNGGNISDSFPHLSGPWLGQTPPGDEPELFAPGIVSTGMFSRDIAMTPDGNEIYWCAIGPNYSWSAIMGSRLENGHWTEPQALPFTMNPEYFTIEPHITPDGEHLYFASNDPAGQGQDIWVCDREGDGWSEPYNPGSPVNTEHAEYFPTLTHDGTIYFTRRIIGEQENAIWRSRLVDGEYGEPERLPRQVNCGTTRYNAFIDPAEQYLILAVDGMGDTVGMTDYFIIFRSPDDTWSEPVNMGEKINTAGRLDSVPYVSPDGRYFFFMSTRQDDEAVAARAGGTLEELLGLHNMPRNGFPDVWWVDASFIGSLKPDF